VNAKDNLGGTALMRAAFDGHKEVVELLLEKGADVNAKDKDGGTALMIAYVKGHKEIVKLLKSYGTKR
jgi:ankyrin repeat protein